MEHLKVCRICLIMDVKMYVLQGYPLETYFEQIVGSNPMTMFDLPSYACYECAPLLVKYNTFRDKCLRGQAVLYSIIGECGKITSENIKNIDRQVFNLSSKLKAQTMLEDKNIFITYDNREEVDLNIKEELAANGQNSSFLLEPGSIKQEDDYDDFQSFISSDDEPLSLHKSNKNKVKTEKKKDRKGKKKEVKNEKITDFVAELVNIEKIEDIEGLVDSSELLQEDSMPLEAEEVEVCKPKRGRPRKKVDPSESKEKPRRTRNTGGVATDEADIEDYVTIIKLSTEEQLEEISKRQQSSNYLNAPYQCNLCYKGFIDTHAWKHHVDKHDPSSGDIECPICKFRFKTKRTLQKHASNHEKKYACKSCTYVSKTTTQAKQHQRWHKGVTYKCQYCDEVSTKWTSYLSHVRIKHPSEFICGVCGYSFVSKLGLAMHKTMMHKQEKAETEGEGGEAGGPYCEECDVKFISAEAYKRHMVTSVKHTQATDFKNGCRVCGSRFSSTEELRAHHRRDHARKRPKNYGKKPSNIAWPTKCEHCSEEIANAREYWTHFRRAHPDKNYPIQKNYICDICGKSFRGNAFLVYHKRTHFEERAYKCGLCDKAFFNRTNLQMHEKTHSDTRPYPCTVCPKAFKSKGALDRHFRSHTGVKPYECEVCGKAFGQSNSRKLHVRTVHLRQPAPYLSRSRLERRNKMQHKEQQHFLY